MRSNYTARIDGLALVALGMLVVMGIGLLSGQGLNRAAASSWHAATPTLIPLSDAFLPIYREYIVTQGLHGQSYGHLAIDLTAGKGAVILSPIDGEVTAAYLDELGNTTLILENDHYQVTLLHGDYLVQAGESIHAGKPVGYESNQGYTIDFQGRPCWGRDCGYHTHLNVYDKHIGSNVNPLDLMNP